MKKYFMLFATIMCLLCLIGCNKENCGSQQSSTVPKNQKITYEGPLSCVTQYGGWGQVSMMDMTEEFHEKTLSILNGGTWMNDVTQCDSDYEFETKGETIRYHSECGTFNDITNQRSLSLSDEEQAEINRMLGAK